MLVVHSDPNPRCSFCCAQCQRCQPNHRAERVSFCIVAHVLPPLLWGFAPTQLPLQPSIVTFFVAQETLHTRRSARTLHKKRPAYTFQSPSRAQQAISTAKCSDFAQEVLHNMQPAHTFQSQSRASDRRPVHTCRVKAELNDMQPAYTLRKKLCAT